MVADAKNRGLNLPAAPQMFVNDLAMYEGSDLSFVVRNLGETQSLVSAVRQKLQVLAPGAFVKFETLDQTISEMTAGPRFNGILLGSFAAIYVVVLTGLGVAAVFATLLPARRAASVDPMIALRHD